MANPSFFRPAFDELATDGCIGDTQGQVAYAYIRVSDEMQAEEGRSGLPRQLEHIHAVALEKGYRIPWEFVFADDASGFEFEGRPRLTVLRREFRSAHRKASVIVMETLDRLSRDADWHQGFLLHEMAKHGVLPVFWKPFSSRIERAVMGMIAQEGMELEKERMKEGTVKKAKSGRITAKVPAVGLKFVDQNGQENTVDARKNTYYAIDEERAAVIRFMYDAIAYRGMSTYELCNALDELASTDPRFRPPRSTSTAWYERSVARMIRSPLYKGVYTANRHYYEQVKETDEFGEQKLVKKVRQRPPEEWIQSSVPAIVDEETWELANRNLYRNKGFARRNKKHDYLLTGLITCATCGRSYHGQTESQYKRISRYWCSNNFFTKAIKEQRNCDQRSVRCSVLDTAVWEAITTILLNPEVLEQAIEQRYSSEQIEEVKHQISFLENEIASKADEERKLYQAYLAEAFTPEEYAAERKRVTQSRNTLMSELESIRSQVISEEEIAEKKAAARELTKHARELVNAEDVPFALKQQIIRLLVDKVVLNTNESWFEISGVIGTRLNQLAKKNSLQTLGSETSCGQETAKRALEIAAAGNHNLRMSGPPGSGKTLLARAMPGILPHLSMDEALEVTRIYSVADLLSSDMPLMRTRPFRAPHHTISQAGMVGGGTIPRPGEVTLSHRGVLFLDEANEQGQHTLEALRQPIEDKIVTISRARGTLTFPANFLLILAHNPCPCGYFGDPVKPCTCTPVMISRYQSKLSGPLLDRVDIHIDVPRVEYDRLLDSSRAESSSDVRTRVEAARARQAERFKGLGLFANADMNVSDIQDLCVLKPDAKQMLDIAVRRMNLSARSYHRVLKLSRTIADLADCEFIQVEHVAEAVQYRPKSQA